MALIDTPQYRWSVCGAPASPTTYGRHETLFPHRYRAVRGRRLLLVRRAGHGECVRIRPAAGGRQRQGRHERQHRHVRPRVQRRPHRCRRPTRRRERDHERSHPYAEHAPAFAQEAASGHQECWRAFLYPRQLDQRSGPRRPAQPHRSREREGPPPRSRTVRSQHVGGARLVARSAALAKPSTATTPQAVVTLGGAIPRAAQSDDADADKARAFEHFRP